MTDKASPDSSDDPVDEPVVGELIEEEVARDVVVDQDATEDIRVGSPFAVDPKPIAGSAIRVGPRPIEPFYDVGPLRYTAMGSVGAAILVLGFALVAVWWFPSGGTIITGLGCALSVFGMYSPRRYVAGGVLGLHLILFMACYSQVMSQQTSNLP